MECMGKRRKLRSVRIENFKSIADQTVELGDLTVLIGANGSGKSNFLGAFRLARAALDDRLPQYVADRGGADRLLRHGRKHSDGISVDFKVDGPEPKSDAWWKLRLTPNDNDGFSIAEADELWVAGDRLTGDAPRPVRPGVISGLRAYHFDDTSPSAHVKRTAKVDDDLFLRSDGENIAAVLYLLERQYPDVLAVVESTIRMVAPFFGRFVLTPRPGAKQFIRLQWEEQGSEAYFGVSDLSDGTLRFICLATLLLQPHPPPLIIIDEPELGLHPAAIHLLASMLRSAAFDSQIIVATQSVTLVDEFTPEQIVSVDRYPADGASVFRRHDSPSLAGWLEHYSLGELFEKNVLGGGP